MKIYYDQNGIRVRTAVKADVDAMKGRLRDSDVHEIYASHHRKPEEALKMCVENTIFAATIENGRPIGIFGINTDNILGDRATIWMLGTDDLDKISTRFLRNNPKFIEMMLEYYPYLENYVHEKNTKSISWLKFLGATIEDKQPYGLDGEMFHHFYFKRSK